MKTETNGKKDIMAIREKLTNEERDNLTKNVDDLDAAYIENMREEGIDPMLIEQFAALLSLDNTDDQQQ